MSYVQPNSRIEFFDDIGISEDYNDTLYFVSESAKDTYFDSINRLAHVDKCYYARDHRGFVRVELPMSTLIHSQYMRFKNTSYENKWWYAFVKDVAYINDNTTEVQFELDPMMSWMGEFHPASCFVERQHSETDDVGANIVDEGLAIGDYVYSHADNNVNVHTRTGKFNTWVYMVFVSEPAVIANPVAKALGIYSGLSVYIYGDDSTGIDRLTDFLKLDQIITNVQLICYLPDAFIPRIPNYQIPYSGATDYSDTSRELAPVIYLQQLDRSFTDIDGYTDIKNNKLFTYPYNMIAVWNSETEENTYAYELFEKLTNDDHIYFNLYSAISEKSEILCAPRGYKGLGVAYNESLAMNHFPICAWTSDAFMAYLAQKLSNMTGFASSREKDVTVKQASAKIAEYASPAVGITAELTEMGRALLTPNERQGESITDPMVLVKQKDFWFYRKTIRGQYAKIIDDYFTMFGYADRTVHVPNMNARTRFTYVKTIGCKIDCRCPASDADFIEELFNKGIRFWKSHTDIGNYTSPNPPIQPVS